MVTGQSLASEYNEDYYKTGLGPHPYARSEPWLGFFGNIASRIKQDFNPAAVLDAGCAIGLLVEAFHNHGIKAVGYDFSPYAIAQAPEHMKPYMFCRSIAEPFEHEADFITCIEVLEHMQEDDSLAAVRNMTQVSDIILFSSTSDDFSEPTHINVRPQEYWLKAFENEGFVWRSDYNASYVCPWAKIFVRKMSCK